MIFNRIGGMMQFLAQKSITASLQLTFFPWVHLSGICWRFIGKNQDCVIPLFRTERYEDLWKEACQRISRSVLLFYNIRSFSLSNLSLVSWLWLRWWEQNGNKDMKCRHWEFKEGEKRFSAWRQPAPPSSVASHPSKPWRDSRAAACELLR